MKYKFFNILFIVFLLLNITDVYADEQETLKILHDNISISQQRISKAEHKVEVAKSRILSANKWEAKNWTEINSAVQNYTSVSYQELGTIDFNIEQLLKLEPTTYIGEIGEKIPDFKEEISQLKAANAALRKKYDKILDIEEKLQKDTKKIKSESVASTEGEGLDIVGVPTDKKGVLENNFTIMLSVMIRGAGTVYSLVKLPFGLYFYAKEMQAQIKSLKTNKDIRLWAMRFKEKTATAINSSDQGIAMLQRWQKSVEKVRENIEKIQSKFKNYADTGKKKQIEEEKTKLEEELKAKQPKVEGDSLYPVDGLKPLPASSYTSKAMEIINAISSAVDAAMDGGDPYEVKFISNDKARPLFKKIEKTKKLTKKASQSYDQTAEEFENKKQEVYSRIEALFAEYKHKKQDKAFRSRYRSLLNQGWAISKAEDVALKPIALKILKIRQEQNRLYRLVYMVQNAVYPLSTILTNYEESTKASFYREWNQYADAFPDYRYSENLYLYKLKGELSFYKKFKQGLLRRKNNIRSKIANEGSTASAYMELLDIVNQLHRYAKEMPKLFAEYKQAQTKRRELAQKYQAALFASLEKNALIILSDTVDVEFESYDLGWKPSTTDRSIEGIEKKIKTTFPLKDKDEIKEMPNVNFNALANKYKELAEQVSLWQDMLSTYNIRRFIAYYRLNKSDKEQISTKIRVEHGDYFESVRKYLQKEMSKGQWQSLKSRIDSSIRKKPKKGLVAWDKMLPREKLLRSFGALFESTKKTLHDYISASQHGGFSYAVDDTSFKTIEADWRRLQPLIKQYNQIASPIHQKLSTFSSDKFKTIIVSENNTYNALPGFLKSVVAVKHNLLMYKYNILDVYYDMKQRNTKALIFENMKKLDNWIKTYPAAKKKAKEREKKANLLRKKQEAERAAEMKLLQEKAKKLYNDKQQIREFYKKFKEAYESKDVSAVTSLLSDDWSSSSDSTDISDLEDYLGKSFRVFDEINYNISNINIQPLGNDKYRVSYNVDIIGQIYDNDITHEEKSSVQEEVGVQNGKVLILKTFGGHFWSVK